MKKIIRLLIKILIGFAICFLCFYFIQAIRAHQIKQVKMMFALEK